MRLGPGSIVAITALASTCMVERCVAFQPLVVPRRGRDAPVVFRMMDGESSSDLINIRVESSAIHSLLPGALSTHGRLFRSTDNKPLDFLGPNEDVSFNVSEVDRHLLLLLSSISRHIVVHVGNAPSLPLSATSLSQVAVCFTVSRAKGWLLITIYVFLYIHTTGHSCNQGR